MAKKITPLTHTQIDKTKPTAKTQKLYDGMGLYLEISPISPKGTNTWRLKYNKLYLNSQDTYTIGHYPAISLLEARMDAGLLLSEKLSKNSHDRVNYYTINYEKLGELEAQKPCGSLENTHSANSARCLREYKENKEESRETSAPAVLNYPLL